MVTIEQIFNLIESECVVDNVKLDLNTDLFNELGIEGDDFSKLIDKYTLNFSVNMDGYLWYFHSNDEGVNAWSFLFKPPNKKVNRIAVTPKILLDCANSKKWEVVYPTHIKPRKRHDLTYSNLFWLVIVLGIYLIAKYT
ncbi:DUF1493 family protein [Pseudoalteromonas sp. TB64]|uniref:DUF1493 family protein n=1 Tax=Pseudoalteromonas sp. TB64 TaxID=1938600 RepID=UPI0004082E13|nr:DUF1493 family protein [Pseudoalteromonas sp. TB64]